MKQTLNYPSCVVNSDSRIRKYAKSSQSQSRVTTDDQSVGFDVETLLALKTRCLLLFDGYCRIFVGSLSDEGSGLSIVSQSFHS
jgi:hypothetical protein